MPIMRPENLRNKMHSPAPSKDKIRVADRPKLKGLQDRSLMRGRFVKVEIVQGNESFDQSEETLPPMAAETSAALDRQTAASLMRAIYEAAQTRATNLLVD